MSTRTSRVEELLRREIADQLLRGNFRDPRLRQTAAISITGVSVSGDLSVARVFVDGLGSMVPIHDVIDGLNAAAGIFRTSLGAKIRMRRVPSIQFVEDVSIERGAAIERVLAELAAESKAREPAQTVEVGVEAGEAETEEPEREA